MCRVPTLECIRIYFSCAAPTRPAGMPKGIRPLPHPARARILAVAVGLTLAVFTLSTELPATEGDDGELTLARVIGLAAANAPEVRLSAVRVAEEEARLTGAAARFREDPRLDLAAGPRTGPDRSVDMDVGFEIPFDWGGLREKRIVAAMAGFERERHTAEDDRRRAVAAAVRAYYRVLHAEESLRSALDRRMVADELLRIARERYHAGDVARLEVNLAQAEVARAEADLSSIRARLAVAQTELARGLGLASGGKLRVAGDIRERNLFDAIRSTAAPLRRADICAALAHVEASRVAVSLAEAEQLPRLGFRLNYKREGNETVALGGITISLPFLNPRPGLIQEARARYHRAQIAAEVQQADSAAEIEGSRRAYDAATEAVRLMEADGIKLQDEIESLAAESYRAGKIDLATLLQVRRDTLDIRRAYLERLLEAAEIGVALASASGMWSTTH